MDEKYRLLAEDALDAVRPVTELAEIRHLSPRRLRRAIRDGECRGYGLDGWMRSTLRDVDRWLESCATRRSA